MRIVADLHTHTAGSGEKNAVLDYVTVAMARGLQALAIVGRYPGKGPWRTVSVQEAEDLRAEVREVGRRCEGLRLLTAVECQVTSPRGDLSLPPELRGEFDLVLASLSKGRLNWASRLHPAWSRRMRTRSVDALVEAVSRREIDVVARPVFHGAADVVELARACALTETAMEINARHQVLTVEHCRVAARVGVKFLINSGGVSPRDVGNVARSIAIARAAGLRPEQVLNSDPERFFSWLARKKGGRGPNSWADWSEQPPLSVGKKSEEPSGARERSYWADWATQGRIH